MKQRHHRKRLFTALSISTALHLIFLGFLYHFPLLVHPFRSLFPKAPPLQPFLVSPEEFSAVEKEQFLEEAFNDLPLQNAQEQKPFDLVPFFTQHLLSPSAEDTSLPQDLPKSPLLPYVSSLPSSPTLALPPLEKPRPLEIAPFSLDFPLAAKARTFTGSVPPSLYEIGELEESPALPHVAIAPSAESPSLPNPSFPHHEDAFESYELPALSLTPPVIPQNPLLAQKDSPPHSSSLAPHTSSLSDEEITRYSAAARTLQEIDQEMRTEVSYIPLDNGEYFFSLTLSPHFEHPLDPIPQHFYFVIDRSSVIEKHRFLTFKKAVLKALSYLQEDSTFNIFLFDKTLTAMSEKNVPVNKKTLKAAEAFLEKQDHGGMFVKGDLFAALHSILSKNVINDQLHTAFLLTDGSSIVDPKKQRLQRWQEKNRGRLSLYTAAVGPGNTLSTLNLLSGLNGGRLLYSDTHAAFPRKFGKLLLDLQHPLVKDLTITALPVHPKTEISLQHLSSHLPAFYNEKSYTLYGITSRLEDFTLSIEGKNGDSWVSIEEAVSFDTAKENKDLFEKWALHQALFSYKDFLEDGNIAHLKTAKKLLESTSCE